LRADAVARSSCATKFMSNESASGLDMFMSIERTTYNTAAIDAVGLNGVANRNNVEASYVATIPTTRPVLFAMLGEAIAASPMSMLETATTGPENASVTLNRR